LSWGRYASEAKGPPTNPYFRLKPSGSDPGVSLSNKL
jgi:hypothetical protein